MRQEGKVLIPDDGKVLIRKADGLVRTLKFVLSKVFRIGNKKYPTGHLETADEYKDGYSIIIGGETFGLDSIVNNYEGLVTLLIRLKYSLDQELALINNIYFEPAKYKKEYLEYLNWRIACKEAAKKYFEMN